MPKPNPMLLKIELKYRLYYEQLFRQRVAMTVQMCGDAATIAANEALHMGPGRAEEFRRAYQAALDGMSSLLLEDQKDDAEYEYTKAKVDQRLKEICGDNFEPWEKRYGG